MRIYKENKSNKPKPILIVSFVGTKPSKDPEYPEGFINDYTAFAYVKPNGKITIRKFEDWHLLASIPTVSGIDKVIPSIEKWINTYRERGYRISEIKYADNWEDRVLQRLKEVNQNDSLSESNSSDMRIIDEDKHAAIPINIIGDYEFRNRTDLTDVVIPDGVKSIGNRAFTSCTNLMSVTIPNSVKSIGYAAFYDCIRLTSIEIPDSVTSIDDSAFENCTSLTSIKIPSNVRNIGSYTFSDCENLTDVVIPDSVTSIGDFAFSYCISLTSIDIPDSVTSIGDNVFENCKNLVVHTSNPYVIEYCIKNDIKYK